MMKKITIKDLEEAISKDKFLKLLWKVYQDSISNNFQTKNQGFEIKKKESDYFGNKG